MRAVLGITYSAGFGYNNLRGRSGEDAPILLTPNVGNMSIAIGGYEGKKLRSISRMVTDRSRTENQYAIELHDILDIYGVKAIDIIGIIIGSVMPPVTTYIIRVIRKLIKIEPVVIGERTVTGLDVRLNLSEALGADLVTGCVTAIELYSGPCIIWDMGAATTVSVIGNNGSMLGSCIIPGAGVSMGASTSHTAQLLAISMEVPDKVVGTNTVDCIRSGLIYEQASMVNRMCDRIEGELGVRCRMIVTGELSRDIASYCQREIIHSCNLLLEGLRMLYEENLPV